jgi:hypothetical protein
MAKVITFSRKFPTYHTRKGENTFFVEAFYKSLYIAKIIPPELENVFDTFVFINGFAKHHTIRSGNRFKVGDLFSPRVWSGKPYYSKQIILSKDVRIDQIFEIEILKNQEIYINDKFYCTLTSTENMRILSENDALTIKDFKDWFKKLPFKGQIICWNKNIKY